MFGWKATDWMTVEAGRMTNPLYTSSMVWDADLNVEGLAEKFKYTMGSTDLFFTALQNEYVGVRKLVGVVASADSGNDSSSFGTTEQFAFQAGLRTAFNDNFTGKGALTFTTYSKNPYTTNFGADIAKNGPTAGTLYASGLTYKATTSTGLGNGPYGNLWGVNNLNIVEIPAEVNYFMPSNNIGIRAFEHFAWNTDADARARNSGLGLDGAGSDDKAWSLGIQVAKAKDLKAFEGNKMSKGDWNARLWYQSVGAWSVDAALVDSDIFDGRVNMEGTAFKAQYNVADNVLLNFTGAWGEKKNKSLYSFGIGDIAGDIPKIDLYQFDVTYKF
jgi:hypothetical protein